jgi:lipoprotein-releasing system permease protein
VTDASGAPLLPIVLDARLFLSASAVATATGLLAALLPARRAAKLDPRDGDPQCLIPCSSCAA